MITRRIIQLALSAVLMIAVFPPLSQVKSPAVFAANGDPVQATYFDTACTSGIGVGIAFDGDGATAWSSDGDGDGAWIEIELAAITRVTRIGFWTRTMGSSAQIQSFQIVGDTGEPVGPFNLTDAAQSYYFDTDFTSRRLRFEVAASTGGNTGAVEIEVYGEPQG